MRKKNVFIFLVIILFIFCNFFAIVYADENKDQINFFSANKTEVTIGEIVEFKIDLEKIEFDNFNLILSSEFNNISMEEIYTENMETTVENNELNMTIEKDKNNIHQISLYYKIPENMKVGDEFSITAKISKIDNEEDIENEITNEIVIDSNVISNELSNTIEENIKINSNQVIDDSQVEKENYITNKIVLKVVEKANNDNENNEQEGIENPTGKPGETDEKIENNEETNNKEFNNSLTNISEKNENNKTTTVSNMSLNSENSKTAEEITYNGSQNNYLKSISVDGYELNNSFTKENTTYFISVNEETTSIEISAEAEEDLATVCIYGNENLKEGTNKVLISVTAENGDVRNYRIYVEK